MGHVFEALLVAGSIGCGSIAMSTGFGALAAVLLGRVGFNDACGFSMLRLG